MRERRWTPQPPGLAGRSRRREHGAGRPDRNFRPRPHAADGPALLYGWHTVKAALENPRLTEALVINSVLRPAASAALVHAVAQHAKWSCRREIRAALLRTEHLSLARALEFSREFPPPMLHELLTSSRLPTQIKDQLLRESQASSPPTSC